TGFRKLIRCPVRHDVVVGFIVSWDLNQLNFSFTPVALRRYPGAWTQVVAIVQVFKARELAATLQQAKALWVFHREAADSEMFRVIQRTPDPLTVTGMNREAIGIMQFRAEVSSRRRLVRPEQEHTGQRRDAQFAHFIAQV